MINAGALPVVLAAIEIHHNKASKAIELLEPARAYFGGLMLYRRALLMTTRRPGIGCSRLLPVYIRGQAYLSQKAGAQAAAEFQKVLDHRGMSILNVIYPLSHLGLARAAVLQGDTPKARKAYENFFALWKDADNDIPILIQAKKEYEKLK